MAKKVELDRHGLGDVTELMHNRGVSDLSWLDVNEEDYRAAEALPKQNLDIIPELQRALSDDDDGDVPRRIPMRRHTIVNVNPLDPPGSRHRNVTASIKNRVAHYVMRGMGVRDIGKRLLLEFSTPQIRMAMEDIGKVLDERGLLGNVYVDSSHFPRCAQSGEHQKFVAKVAAKSLFVLAKDDCSRCVHAQRGSCTMFKKRLVASVPYGEKTLAHYAVVLASEGRAPEIGGDVRMSLRTAFRKSPRQLRADPIRTVQSQKKPARPEISDSDVASFVQRRASSGDPETPSATYMKAALHMMRGGDPASISGSPEPEIRRVASDHGVIGHTYLDADALGGCRNTLAFIKKMASPPRYVVMRSSTCPICKGASDGACHEIGKVSAIVSGTPQIGRTDFEAALRAAALRGAMDPSSVEKIMERVAGRSDWKSLTAQANLLTPKKSGGKQYEGGRVKSFHGRRSTDEGVTPVDPEDIRRRISHLMNTGLKGINLRKAILSQFVIEDLKKVPEVVKRASARDGVQGTYFIDPTAYPDYGRGCSIGSSKLRKNGAKYAIASSACTGCTMQTAPGWCSKYGKSLIRRVPTEVMRHAVEVRKAEVHGAPVVNPVAEYELESPDMPVDLNGSKSDDVSISMPEKVVTE